MNIRNTKIQELEKNMKKQKTKVKMSISIKLLVMSIAPIFILAVIMTIYSISALSSALQKESLDGLHMLTESIGSGYAAIDYGDYHINSNGELYKGDFNITQNTAVLDSFVKNSNVEITIFYGDTRYATTIIDSATSKRIIGTKASATVISEVLNSGKNYQATKLTINNQPYNAYYIPLKNTDGKTVGMAFAGEPSTYLTNYIKEKAIGIIIIAVGIMAISTIFIVIFSRTISGAIKKAELAINDLSRGNLNISLDKKVITRNDEIGTMGRSLNTLIHKLQNIIGNIKNSSTILLKSGDSLEVMAALTSRTTDEISNAVSEISSGAVAQAEDIEKATTQVVIMGNSIEDIVSGVSKLDDTSYKMKKSGDETFEIIEDLSKSNDKTTEAIQRIDAHVHATDESVRQIQSAVAVITSIANQTNLLSLNASIEAARAGEAGRGFAVVATEIKNLSEESNSSAKKIEEVISKLSSDSQSTVEVMNQVKAIIEEQQKKLDETKVKFLEVNNGIDSSIQDTSVIKNQSDVCDTSRKNVEDIIQNLAAVSEENAASTEQTTASMQELNATINLLAESAGELKRLSEDLDDNMKFFQL